MKLLYDIFSIIVFIAVFKIYGFFEATAAIIVLLFISLLAYYLKHRKLDKMQAGLFILVLLLALPTLFLQNELFFKWKPTVVNWLFAIVLLATHLFGQKKSFIQKALEQQNLHVPASLINRVSVTWIVYFFLMGLINIYVVYHFSTEFWVYFKFLGTLGSMLVLAILSVIYLAPHIHQQGTP
jgi:intracellular septation protein